MTRPCRTLATLSVMLVPFLASAQERTAQLWKTTEDVLLYERILNGREPEKTHATRHFFVRHEPTDRVLDIYVAGGVSTLINLPSKLQPRGTHISGGEQRFRLVMGDQEIVIIPTRELANGERFPMIVTLANGTVIPLSLTRAVEGHQTDGQVQISKEPENAEELRLLLMAMTERAKSLEESLRQAQREQASPIFGVAEALAGNRADLTSFVRMKKRDFRDGAGRKIVMETYASPPDAPHAVNEVATVFRITNKGTEPLELSAARAYRGKDLDPVSLALRIQPRAIPPGQEGTLAVVLDRASFGSSDGKIVVDFFSKSEGGQREFSVDLAIGDFEEDDGSSWWPF